MRLTCSAGPLVAVGLVLALCRASFGQELLSFTYSDLDGDFTASSQVFTVADDADSDGDVTRLIAPTGDAFFAGTIPDGGFPGLASFGISMTVTDIDTETAVVAPGAGALTLSDVDGDEFTSLLQGTWYNVGGSAAFIGTISDFWPDNSGDDTFDGTDGSSILMTFAGLEPPFEGNIITLAFGDWFTDPDGTVRDFADATTLANGVVVPEPASLSLLALAGLAVLGRRRR